MNRLASPLLCLVALAACWPAPLHAEDRPNVVLIISDDQAWTDFGFMGHPVIETPHLDRLAEESLVYTRGYVPTSLCRASLATLATGLYPHQHRLTSNDPPSGTDRSWMLRHMAAAATLPRWLATRGYLSLQTGKWWEGHHSLGGFTHGMTHGDPTRGGRHGDEGLRIGREGLEPVFDFIRAAGDQPFFVWYAPMMPHTPHNPPQRLLAKYTADERHPAVARYWAMCEWFDETCGELLDFLDEQGLRENTLVAFVVDNGWIQETGPQRTRGPFAPKSKLSPYDGGLRTPILLRLPGKISPGRDETTLVSSVDLVPSILSACGVAPPETLPGTDLLRQPAAADPATQTAFGAIFTHDAVDIDQPAANLSHRWCVEGWTKLIVSHEEGAEPELYDLRDDPTETDNLASAQPDAVARLTGLLDRWWPLPASSSP